MPTCPSCQAVTPEGCTCAFRSTDSIAVNPVSTDAQSVNLELRLAADPENLLEFQGAELGTDPDAEYLVKPHARITKPATDSISGFGATTFPVSLTVTDYASDPDMVDLFNFQIVAVRPGFYRMGAQLQIAYNSLDVLKIMLVRNRDRVLGECEVDRSSNGNFTTDVQVWAEQYMDTNDTLMLWFQYNFGPSFTINQNATSPFLWMSFVRDA